MEALLKLSWQTQVALGSGYAAYMLAYIGIREHHKAVDVTFRAIAFGLVASFVLYLSPSPSPIVNSLAAFFCSVLFGIAWRYFGMNMLRRALRSSNVSWADDTPTAWSTISSANSQHKLTQLSLLLKDGTWLISTPVGAFNDDPFGPCVLGQTGDVAMYVTMEIEPDGTEKVQSSVRNEDFGVRLTYVPAEKIERVSMRHLNS